jgi:hypothetical protein
MDSDTEEEAVSEVETWPSIQPLLQFSSLQQEVKFALDEFKAELLKSAENQAEIATRLSETQQKVSSVSAQLRLHLFSCLRSNVEQKAICDIVIELKSTLEACKNQLQMGSNIKNESAQHLAQALNMIKPLIPHSARFDELTSDTYFDVNSAIRKMDDTIIEDSEPPTKRSKYQDSLG